MRLITGMKIFQIEPYPFPLFENQKLPNKDWTGIHTDYISGFTQPHEAVKF